MAKCANCGAPARPWEGSTQVRCAMCGAPYPFTREIAGRAYVTMAGIELALQRAGVERFIATRKGGEWTASAWRGGIEEPVWTATGSTLRDAMVGIVRLALGDASLI